MRDGVEEAFDIDLRDDLAAAFSRWLDAEGVEFSAPSAYPPSRSLADEVAMAFALRNCAGSRQSNPERRYERDRLFVDDVHDEVRHALRGLCSRLPANLDSSAVADALTSIARPLVEAALSRRCERGPEGPW